MVGVMKTISQYDRLYPHILAVFPSSCHPGLCPILGGLCGPPGHVPHVLAQPEIKGETMSD